MNGVTRGSVVVRTMVQQKPTLLLILAMFWGIVTVGLVLPSRAEPWIPVEEVLVDAVSASDPPIPSVADPLSDPAMPAREVAEDADQEQVEPGVSKVPPGVVQVLDARGRALTNAWLRFFDRYGIELFSVCLRGKRTSPCVDLRPFRGEVARAAWWGVDGRSHGKQVGRFHSARIQLRPKVFLVLQLVGAVPPDPVSLKLARHFPDAEFPERLRQRLHSTWQGSPLGNREVTPRERCCVGTMLVGESLRIEIAEGLRILDGGRARRIVVRIVPKGDLVLRVVAELGSVYALSWSPEFIRSSLGRSGTPEDLLAFTAWRSARLESWRASRSASQVVGPGRCGIDLSCDAWLVARDRWDHPWETRSSPRPVSILAEDHSGVVYRNTLLARAGQMVWIPWDGPNGALCNVRFEGAFCGTITHRVSSRDSMVASPGQTLVELEAVLPSSVPNSAGAVQGRFRIHRR